MWTQVLCFRARCGGRSLSTASGALIAPTALCTENIIKQFYPRMSDRANFCRAAHVLVSFSLAALVFALEFKRARCMTWCRMPTK